MKKTTVSTKEDHNYDSEDFYDDDSPSARSHTPSPHGRSHGPRPSWIEDEKCHDSMVDISTQTVVHSGRWMHNVIKKTI